MTDRSLDHPTGSLEQAVARALEQIRHTGECERLRRSCAPFKNHAWDCRCDREQRLAARVAAAIEAACRETANYLPVVPLGDRRRAEHWGEQYALTALSKPTGEST